MNTLQRRLWLVRCYKWMIWFGLACLAYVFLDFIFNAPELPQDRAFSVSVNDFRPGRPKLLDSGDLPLLVMPAEQAQDWRVFHALGTDRGCPLRLTPNEQIRESCSSARYLASGQAHATNASLAPLRQLDARWNPQSQRLTVYY